MICSVLAQRERTVLYQALVSVGVGVGARVGALGCAALS